MPILKAVVWYHFLSGRKDDWIICDSFTISFEAPYFVLQKAQFWGRRAISDMRSLSRASISPICLISDSAPHAIETYNNYNMANVPIASYSYLWTNKSLLLFFIPCHIEIYTGQKCDIWKYSNLSMAKNEFRVLDVTKHASVGLITLIQILIIFHNHLHLFLRSRLSHETLLKKQRS